MPVAPASAIAERLASIHLVSADTRKAVSTMQENGTQPEFAECFQFPDAVRLLWEGTQKALGEWGMDQKDLLSLCDIIVRLADHRLLLIAKCGSPGGSEEVADQVQHYRKMASDLLQWAAASVTEPDWSAIAEKLKSVDAAPLQFLGQPRE